MWTNPRLLVLTAALLLLDLPRLAQGQAAPGETLLDPQATCPQATRDSITTCLGQVEIDEAQRAGGPCNDGDWPCICNKQYGLIACYAPCPGIQPAEDVTYNQNNCAGQHDGVRNGAAGGPATYIGAALTTTAPNGATGTAGSAGGGPAASTQTAPSNTQSAPSTNTSSTRPTGTSTGAGSGSGSGSGGNTSSTSPAGTGDAATSLRFGSVQSQFQSALLPLLLAITLAGLVVL